MPAYQYTFPQATDEVFFNYALPLTPSDFGSEDGAPFCSPRSRTTSLSFQAHPEGRTHATSGVSLPSIGLQWQQCFEAMVINHEIVATARAEQSRPKSLS